MAVVLRNVILGEPSNDTVPYAVAASIVLFPLAFTCDFFYRKYEPAKKYGAAMIIMVVHAVLFAVLGIMSLIIAVFIGIDMLMNTVRSTDSQTVNLLVAAFAALLYVGAFLRTLNPFKAKRPTAIYAIAMTTLTAALLALVIAGPVVTSLATRDDRLIEVALPQVQQSIGEYISDNDKLPASLNDVSFTSDEARELVEDGKVEYKAVGKVEKIVLNNTTNENTTSTYRYELCVDYKATKNSENARRFTPDNGAYAVSLTTYAHGAGPTCYKLQQTVYPWSRN